MRQGYHRSMRPPGITRSRRPFFAPVWLAMIAAIGAAFVGVGVLRSMATTTVVLVRHAEKQLSTIEDAPLTTDGEARAERLAAMLGERGDALPIARVFTSEARRTQQTAAPLARRLGIAPTTMPARNVDELVRALRDAPSDTASVVVGHGNTVPEVIRALTRNRIAVKIDEADYGSMFVVTVSTFGPPSVVRLQY
jgi:2,3-bisphosphoglycerate-dependent phosphoglycerate mutase